MASLKYFLLRAVLFVVPFAVFMVLRIGVVLSAVYAVLIAFAINFLFLTRQRNAAASEVRDVFGGRKQVRTKREVADAEVEDALDDAQRADEDAEYDDAEGTATERTDAEGTATEHNATEATATERTGVPAERAADENRDRTLQDRKAQNPQNPGGEGTAS
ncbi:DUF4229 domain-containing protein [Sinomonas atrocyanea]|uniref:DUF4229 domain-containing protein n=1 Tax=Sinomonas atrocyanea TaxID=37927 RepID=UPI002786B38B|nr:DUF4229 domain-containing protein [Sinomonas atrocyanea]MDQ0258979.1 outer membrane murein-binding lipoprotein Lpp [Sinomonas atrocyanea]MDR6621914.1 outer membrane murein-binding lipoprotein Lpp [Sinomonas atrocyanea]